MQWKKILSVVLSGVLFAGALAGCSGGGNTTTDTEPSAEASADADSGDAPEETADSDNAAEETAPEEDSADGEMALDDEKVLNIFTWAGYIPDDIIADWEAETGVKINYSNFDTNENMLAKLQASGGAEYDLVIASDYIISTAVKEKLVQPLDKEAIPHYANLNSSFLSKFYDSNNEYTVPYGPGGPLIIYDSELVDVDIQGFEQLWDAKLADSLVTMGNMRVLIGSVLLANGYSMNSTNPDELEVAREQLMALKPNIVALNDDNPQSMMISGEAAVGYIYTSQIVEALAARPDLKLVYPKEGIGFGIDAMFIPSKAPHPKNANAFLNFILDGQRSAQIYEQIGYICPNDAAQEFLSEDYKANPAYNIPAELVDKAEFIEDIPADALAEYDRIWTEFRQ